MGDAIVRNAIQIDLRVIDARLTNWGFPHYGSDLAAGLDLHACLDEPLVLQPGTPAVLISAGFAMRIGRAGWCAILAPRSGMGHRGLVLGNTVGVIDADYEGTVMVSAWNRNTRGADGAGIITIEPGDRIAQLLLVEAARPHFNLVTQFEAASRRAKGGFGSTGHGAPGRQG